MIRLAHVSDVHLYAAAKWRPRDWCSKRLPGWLNSCVLWRRKLFRDSADVLQRLMDDIDARRPDALIFTGDATCLGFEEEFARAAAMLRVGQPGAVPGFAVPGNHDYYTRYSAPLGHFERYFAAWLEGERVDGATYPFARRIGEATFIGLNSCTGNRWFWDAAGSVGGEQLERLRRLLSRLGADAGPRVLVTHYPIACRDGRPERWNRCLRDLSPTLEVVQAGGVSLWLHGHRHHPYAIESPIPAVCAGSGTQRDVWTYAEYVMEGRQIKVERRVYEPAARRFRSAEELSMRL